jgi:hypothetical protein
MRDYGVVSPKFWIVGTGKELRGDRDAQLVALYLMTSPHAAATGVFHLPILYISHEIGIPLDGASKALQRLIREDFCTYDEACDSIFVHNLARIQVGESLSIKDKRVDWLKKEVEKMTSKLLKQRFLAVYGVAYKLVSAGSVSPPNDAPSKALECPLEDPPKPGSGSGSGSITGSLEECADVPRETTVRAPRSRATRLPDDFALTPERTAYAARQKIDPQRTFENFRDYWNAAGGAKARKCDWDATWRMWCRREQSAPLTGGSGGRFQQGAPARNDDAAWAEALSLAKEIGFREPHRPAESVTSYMREVTQFRDRPPEVPLSERRGLAGIKRIGAT